MRLPAVLSAVCNELVSSSTILAVSDCGILKKRIPILSAKIIHATPARDIIHDTIAAPIASSFLVKISLQTQSNQPTREENAPTLLYQEIKPSGFKYPSTTYHANSTKPLNTTQGNSFLYRRKAHNPITTAR